MTNNRPGVAGRGGNVGHGGREKKQVNKPKPGKKSSTYTSDTEALKNDIFDCGKPKHAAAFKNH